MLKIWNILFILWTILINKLVFINSEFCPPKCKCDLYENQNRAICSGWKIINAAINIPKIVEIFDLSNNSITTLDNNCFEGLSHLLNLTINYNSIHTIYLDAFKQLNNVKYIDLSYNRLEYIDDRIFENNNKLIELNLSGNKFMSLQNKQLINSKSIEKLYLKNTQITHIYTQLFEWLPSIKYLDLSKNLMITITITPFNKLRKLNMINLEGNRWICDKNIVNVVSLMRHRNINVNMNDECKNEINSLVDISKNRNIPQKFERMIMESPTTENDNNILITTTERVQTNIQTIWNNLDIKSNDNCMDDDDLDTLCDLYKECLTKNDKLFELVNKKNNENDASPNFFKMMGDVQGFFFVGMACGAALVFIMVACSVCVSKCCTGTRRTKRNPINRSVPTDDFEYVPASTPPSRISRRPIVRSGHPLTLNRSMSTPARRTVATNQSDFATFVTRLFERPSRHRYYRTINQNTAHMIRRLSRSNLLNNRLSRHFLDETNRNTAAANTINHGEPEEEGCRLMNLSDSVNRIQLSERPETPPPAYKEVAMMKY